MKLSVIIPAYNEQERLPATLRDAYAWLQANFDDSFEIVVVDDGSVDATSAKVRELAADMPELRLLQQPHNRGKGAAVRRGMLESVGTVRLFMDADHATHISEVVKVMPAIDGGADVVVASRQHPDSDIAQHQSWLREHMGQGFNLLMRGMVGLDMPDTQCGFKAFTAVAADAVFSRQKLDGFSFDVEALFLAQALGLNMVEIPVRWVNEPNSRVRILVDPMKMFADLIRIRRLHRADPAIRRR
ncbi:glycosyltransferase family 2 protein [Mariprofundus erugo]|uniref:dolichyl-phosphate beta-glucosyltransferase n=1 Tax=Mariprofundus erugo TaxID=2528639 RepID=A0A5R9GSB2_9PROT|nr:dolichyl-phosphate beta-glucosyltransferase [Mariprofundus erugo]TLS66942.1 glycosyltransferase family 2 protein [Mariprofundus erugo]